MTNQNSSCFLKGLTVAFALAAAGLLMGVGTSATAKEKHPAAKAKDAKAKDAKSEGAGADEAKSGKKNDKAGGGKSRQLGSYGAWNALASNGKDKTCYALGLPKDRQPKAKFKDTQAYIFITTRPREGVHDEVAIDLGYPTKDNGAATADIDGDAYDLITKGSNAWVKNAAKEKEFVDALKGGATLIVKASSVRGAATTDTYSLKGLSDALARVAQECK